MSQRLDMRLMDIVHLIVTYIWKSEGFKMLKANDSFPRTMFSIKFQRSLYGLKHSWRMWYSCLSEYLLKEGYKNEDVCPCVFIKKTYIRFAIVVVYVNDLNLIRTIEELEKIVDYLKMNLRWKIWEKQNSLFDCKLNISLKDYLPINLLI